MSESSKGIIAPHALRVGSWNMGWPTTPKNITRKKRRELEEKKSEYIEYWKKSDCDVIALQETNYCIRPEDFENYGYTLLTFEKREEWSKYPSVGRGGKLSDRGLAFLIKGSDITVCDNDQPHPRMAYIEFKFSNVDMMLMNLYAVPYHSNDKSELDARAFFRYITNFIAEKSFPGILILCGDLNAFPDQASMGLYEPLVGKHVYGSSNKHGDLFVKFLESSKLFHLNSRFEKPTERKWTWKQREAEAEEEKPEEVKPNSKSKREKPITEVDGFLCSRTDIVQDVDTLVDESPSDHRLIASLWCISNEYESRGNRSETKLEGYQAALDDLIFSEPVEEYSEFVNRILGAAPKENRPIGIVNDLNGFPKDVIESYFQDAFLDTHNIAQYELNSSDFSEKEKRLVVGENEVNSELEKQKNSKISGKDKITANMIKNGGAEMVKTVTKLFNKILESDECDVPDAWKTVIFEAPLQTVFPPARIEDVMFNERVCPLVHVYSNLLVGKCYKQLCSYAYKNEQLASSHSSFEKIRKYREIENLFTMSLLLERYSSKEPVYLLFAKFEKPPMENVTLYSVLEGLDKSSIHPKVKIAFASLLNGARGEFVSNDETISCNKEIGIHLGDVASSMLLGCVIRMVLDECDKKEERDSKKLGLQFGDQKLRRIVWNDMIVFIGKDFDDLEKQAKRIRRAGKDRNLQLDTNSMVFIANEFLSRKLSVNSITIEKSEIYDITHRKQAVEIVDKVCKAQEGTKIIIKIRTRQIREKILQEIASWEESFLEILPKEALVETNGKEKETPDKSKDSQEDVKMKALQIKTLIWKENAEKFFQKSIIPMFFENCGSWNLAEYSSIEEACSTFLNSLNIPNFPFNPYWHVLTEQAHFLSYLNKKDNKLILEFLKDHQKLKTPKKSKTKQTKDVGEQEESSNQEEKNKRDGSWIKELNVVFEGFKKVTEEVKNMDALQTLQNKNKIWDQFVEYCEKRIYV